jgi:predicted acylesterase/phospholipase RssA
MRRPGLVAAMLVIATWNAGCLTPRHYPPPNLPSSTQLVSIESPTSKPRADSVVQVVNSSAEKPHTVLAVSGGGLFGAFTVGILKGWSDTGTRPSFDVVTGVSTGALIAPLAFIGPEYDDLLEQWYTTAKPRDIFRRRPLATILFSDSLAESKPLQHRIETVVTPDFLDRIAREHAKGRRLYVGTTNLDTKRLVVWDMGAIAAGDDPNKLTLFRNVILASCSIPGLLPPVAIDVEVNGHRRTELHVDGGVSASVFVPPCAFEGESKSATGKPATNVFVIVSGKVAASGRPVPRGLMDISEESLEGIFQAQIRGNLQDIALAADRAAASFGFTSVPEEYGSGESSINLTPKSIKRLFEEGYRFAVSGANWHRIPPSQDANSQPTPRTGTRLSIAEDSAPNNDRIPASVTIKAAFNRR